jgi:signal peptidase I
MASSKNSAETPTAKHKGWRSVLSNAGLLVAAPLFAILLTMFVFQSYEVEGMSMEHTLQNKDRLVVLKIPRTVSRLTHNAYTPKRYDIIVFNSQLLQKQLIKRVIGLPGDRVVIADGHVTVYNAEHRAGYRPDTGQEYAAGLPATPGRVDTFIGDNEVFVLGDNRSNSEDSSEFGPIPTSDIVGKLTMRLLPVRSFTTF